MRSLLAPIVLAACVFVSPTSALHPPEGKSNLASMATQHSGAMVTLKFMLKFDEGEQESEAPGVMIEKDGLVLASNRNLGGNAPFGPNANPTDIKVLIGEDTQGVDATLFARDSELGLAWVKIKEPTGSYACVDFSNPASPGMGESLHSVSLLSKFFDRAPSVTSGTVSAVTGKPRKLLVPSLSLAASDLGVPMFADDGRPAGVVTLILPDEDELTNNMQALQEIFRGIPGGKVILPADEVHAATKRAKETTNLHSADAPPAEKPAEPGANTPAPTEPATPK